MNSSFGARRVGGVIVAIALFSSSGTWVDAQQPREYPVNGMVLTVDPSRTHFVVSHDAIPGLMAAMTMRFDVRTAAELNEVVPGAIVRFTLVVGKEAALAERVQVVAYQSVEQDPLTARRLNLLRTMAGRPVSKPVAAGQAVPDFSLTDQKRRQVSLSQFRGKVVAVNFIYTSCALPQFCYRMANHFGVVQERFRDRMGRDLVLLTVTFDPARDTPERLAEYASQWKADPDVWHMLTGPTSAIQRVCNLFGVDFFPDEGLMSHSLHTAVIDRSGTLVANIEGNRFTAAQLGDLLETTLRR
jgi:protein SCO1